MRYRTTLIAAAVLASVYGLSAVQAADTESKHDFVRLYNGKNLDGWEVQDGKADAWIADGELVSCVHEGGGWLRSAKKYSDFVLRMEYRLPAGGNSGVGIRFPDQGNPAFAGIEIQILDDDDPQYKGIKEAQHTGSLYYEAAAKQGAAKNDGEWNKYEITCLGRQIKVVLNGKVINDVDLDKYTERHGEGSALADRPEYGRVGMQSHGSRVDFRNVELKDLTTTTDSGVIYSDVKIGKGKAAEPGSTVTVHSTTRLLNGHKVRSTRDKGEPVTELLSDVTSGWQQGVVGMKAGGRRKMVIPPHLDSNKVSKKPVVLNRPVEADSILVLDVEVLKVE